MIFEKNDREGDGESMRNGRAFWDKKADFFVSREKQRKYGGFTKFYEIGCLHYIEPLLPPIESGRILEAGCGIGRWVFHLAPRGYSLELLDISPEMIRHAAERVRQKGLAKQVSAYHTLDICDMRTIPDNRFDLVLALGAPLSLCGHPEKAVEEMYRITRPGGYLIGDVAHQNRAVPDTHSKSKWAPLLNVIKKGEKVSNTGVSVDRFQPEKLAHLLTAKGFETLHLAAVCPFFEFPPTKEQIGILDDPDMFRTLHGVFVRHAEDTDVLALSGRLIMVAQKRKDE